MLPFFSDNVLLLIYSFYMSFHFRIVATVLDFSQEERGKNFLSFSQSTFLENTFFQARLVWRVMRRVGWLAYLANIEAGKRLQWFKN